MPEVWQEQLQECVRLRQVCEREYASEVEVIYEACCALGGVGILHFYLFLYTVELQEVVQHPRVKIISVIRLGRPVR